LFSDSGNNRVILIDSSTRRARVFASGFNYPQGIVLNPSGDILYVADASNNRICQVFVSNGTVSVIAGSGIAGIVNGTGTNARFNYPSGLSLSPSGLFLYVADYNNHRIRMITLATQQVSSFAGSGVAGFGDGVGTAALFNYPYHLVVDPSGTFLYVTDQSNHRIRRVDLSTRVVLTIAGTGTAGFSDGSGLNVMFNVPAGISIDSFGTTLYVSDSGNNRIRRISLILAPKLNT